MIVTPRATGNTFKVESRKSGKKTSGNFYFCIFFQGGIHRGDEVRRNATLSYLMHPPLYSMDCKRIKQNCPPVSTWTFTSTEPVELLVLAAPQSSVCSTSQSDQSRSWETCNIICCRFYKFVLVFEPYMCQHFVSDLIWAVLSTDMVPVVFGKDERFWKSENLLFF